MPRISMLLGEEELRLIDRAAPKNRTAFMVAAAVAAARQRLRDGEDRELARIAKANRRSGRELAEEFNATLEDGL
jgi:uncharacterized protein (DUF1778 family)